MGDPRPKDLFKALTRHRSGYQGVMFDVQLQVVKSGALIWSQSFSHERQAHEFHQKLEDDLDNLDLATFRRQYGVPSSS